MASPLWPDLYTRAGAVEDAWYSDGVMRLDQIKPAWAGRWMIQQCSLMTPAIVNALAPADTAGDIIVLLGIVLQIPTSTCLPSAMVWDPRLSTVVFNKRAADVGNVLQAMISAGAVNARDGLFLPLWSAYEFTWLEQDVAPPTVCSSIKHTASGVVARMPPHVYVTPQYELKAPFSDAHARLELYPLYYCLYEFFPATVSFRRHLATDAEAEAKIAAMAEEICATNERMMMRPGEESNSDSDCPMLIPERVFTIRTPADPVPSLSGDPSRT